MTTASQAIAAITDKIKDNLPDHPVTGEALPAYFYGGDKPILPDEPSPFIYTLFDASPDGVIEIGGGRGANRHRQNVVAEILVFIPIDWGLSYGLEYAETFAAAFRGFSSGGVNCDRVTVYPGGPGSQLSVPGLSSDVANYFWSGCEAEFYFDQIG